MDCLVIELVKMQFTVTLYGALHTKGMLHKACQQYPCPRGLASVYTTLCRKVLALRFARTETLASLHCPSGSNAMQTFRQRRTSDRLAARSHTTQSHKDMSEPANTMLQAPTQPAAKKRKTTEVKPVRKGLKDRSTAQHQVDAPALFAEEATSSADTVFDATPAIPSASSAVPVSVPAHVPADPDVLHCWTKESMAQAAACLAERDPGCLDTVLSSCCT